MKLSTQQKFDSAVIAVGLAVLLFLFGMLAAPQPASATAPIEPVTIASASVDGESEPSGVAGMTTGELLRDAWATYRELPSEAPSGQYTIVPEYAASFGGTPPVFPGDYFPLESSNFPGVFHVFHMIAAQRA